MPRPRDVAWAVVVALILLGIFDFYPSWTASKFIRTQADLGFRIAYAGGRMAGGSLIMPPDTRGMSEDPLRPTILGHGLMVVAKDLSWNGQQARMVVRNTVTELKGPTHTLEAYVELQRVGSQWVLTHFEPRGHGPIEPDPDQNAFAAAIKQHLDISSEEDGL